MHENIPDYIVIKSTVGYIAKFTYNISYYRNSNF